MACACFFFFLFGVNLINHPVSGRMRDLRNREEAIAKLAGPQIADSRGGELFRGSRNTQSGQGSFSWADSFPAGGRCPIPCNTRSAQTPLSRTPKKSLVP